ncbi:MAG: hypothetical protein H0U75_05290 [Legionella sp.]|nr:hypothetical protein [Legionella sp.]
MRFKTELQRLQHPQARLIPVILWEKYSGGYLSEDMLHMMQAEDNECLSFIGKLQYAGNKKITWIALAVSHPTLGPPELEQIACKLEIKSDLLQFAIQVGNLDLISFLTSKEPYSAQKARDNFNYKAKKSAAYAGHLAVFQYFDTDEPLEYAVWEKMYTKSGFYGHLSILQYLEEKEPLFLARLINDNSYLFTTMLATAATNYRLDILQHFQEKAPRQLETLLALKDFNIFNSAVREKNIQMVEKLLQFHVILAYAEAHGEYDQFVNPYISKELESLHQQKSAFELNNTNTVFDVDLSMAERGFYILRKLIRLSCDPAILDDIRFLLSIPAIRNLAHKASADLFHTQETTGRQNDLLLLALRTPNEFAAELLLNIPAIRALAVENNYYRSEFQDGVDLRALALDRESSMTALTTGEQSRLQAALTRYNPTLQKKGMVSEIMQNLRHLLQCRFEEKPAVIAIERDGVESSLRLPFLWINFEKLTLSPQERKAANTAYHQHKDHTAWRYLSKPNPWMHPKASHVNGQGLRLRWAAFEEYQPLIALFFLAVIDKEVDPIDGFTLETRLEHFISEIALIGRAHNWVKTKVVDEMNKPILDKEGRPLTIEADKVKKGDKPSCFSGAKRRLFQSVQGHTLFKVLNTEILAGEIRNFVRQHFIQAISLNNPYSLNKAWDDLTLGEQGTYEVLKVLDISEIKIQQFLHNLESKYGPQFQNGMDLKEFFNKAFELKNSKTDCHAISFGYVGVGDLLQKALANNHASNPNVLFQIKSLPPREQHSYLEYKP